jgi:hypothetical protein
MNLEYTIDNGTPELITGLTSDGSGNSSFVTSTLTEVNDGQLLQITGITITSETPNCTQAFSQEVILSVIPLPTATISSSNDPICAGDDVVFTLNGTSGSTVTYNINSGSNATVTLTGGTATITVSAATANQTLTLISVNVGSCSQTLSGSSEIIVNPLPEIGSFN